MRIIIVFFICSSIAFGQKTYQKNRFENGSMNSQGWVEDNLKTDYWLFYHKNGQYSNQSVESPNKRMNSDPKSLRFLSRLSAG